MKSLIPYCCLLLGTAVSNAAISISGSTKSGWISLGANYDFGNDQQTGVAASDIVGTATDPGFFTSFDNAGTASLTDGFLGFRVRLDDHGGNNNNIAFGRDLWIGIDANLDGKLDVFLGLNMQGSASEIGIYATGTGANISPKTTSVASSAYKSYTPSASNYNYRAVNYLTDGGTTNDIGAGNKAEPDYYVSFLVAFADVVSFLNGKSISINQNTSLRYVLATSTQANSLNEDLGGIKGSVNSASTWSSLGGFSPTISAAGQFIPECSTSLLAMGSMLGLLFNRRR